MCDCLRTAVVHLRAQPRESKCRGQRCYAVATDTAVTAVTAVAAAVTAAVTAGAAHLGAQLALLRPPDVDERDALGVLPHLPNRAERRCTVGTATVTATQITGVADVTDVTSASDVTDVIAIATVAVMATP